MLVVTESEGGNKQTNMKEVGVVVVVVVVNPGVGGAEGV